MAKIEPSLLGKFKGKLGNLVFYTLKGQPVARTLPSGSSGELSDLQKYHQRVFALANAFLTPFKGELNFTLSAYERGGKKGFHQGLSWLIKNAILHGENPRVIPEQVLISMGSLTGPRDAKVERHPFGMLEVTWTPNAWEGSARDSDRAYLLVYDAQNSRTMGFRSGNYRRAGSQKISLPWNLAEEEKVWVYLAFYKEKQQVFDFSNSLCLGLI